MTDIPMPRLSDCTEEGTILKWLKATGDTVAAGEEHLSPPSARRSEETLSVIVVFPARSL